MTVTILTGDCRDVLRTLPPASVHCVVTSPPYWGLRDYGTATWEGGDPLCKHTGVARRCDNPGRNDKQSTQKGSSSDRISRDCLLCGARRIDRQLGLEPSYTDYIAAMVAVFREVRRVLRPDGTLWLNMGDSYATSVNGRSAADTKTAGNDDRTFRDWKSRVGQSGNKGNPGADHHFRVSDPILKPKDLCGIPWRVAFALQADGWYLRQDIIWSKPNPMPESVRDRCTKAHEYLFLLAKSEHYYFDQELIREPIKPNNEGRMSAPAMDGYRSLKEGYTERRPQREKQYEEIKGANRRSVWEIATAPFPEAHFATFPPALIEPCIMAGCPKGGTVLDPFGGAGTTGLVADRLGRNAILIELNPTYAEMAERRLRDDAGMFAEISREQPDDYDAQGDIEGSFSEAYRAIRERKAAGGPGWEPK